MSKIYDIDENTFRQVISQCYSESQCLKEFGCSSKGGFHRKKFRQRCKELEIDLSHFSLSKTICASKANHLSTEEILVKNSPYKGSSIRLKNRLISEGILEYKCSKCGNTGEWLGSPLALQLHHKDGDNTNNEKENLDILCPNCHSQTDNFSGKKHKKEKKKCEICGKELSSNRHKICGNCLIEKLRENPFYKNS